MRDFLLLLLLTALCAYPSWAQDLLGLEVAAGKGDIGTVRVLIESGLRGDTPNRSGRTPVHAAASRSQLEILQFFLNQGFELDTRDIYGISPLHKAASYGNAETCRFLINNGADPLQAYQSTHTPLYEAVTLGREENILALLDFDRRGDWPQEPGETTLFLSASQKRSPVVLEALLKAGAQPDRLDREGRNAFHHAALGNNARVLKVLMGTGLSPESKDKNQQSAITLALERRYTEFSLALLPYIVDKDQALASACRWNNFEVVQRLLQLGASAQGGNCLVLACDSRTFSPHNARSAVNPREEQKSDSYQIVKLLLAQGAKFHPDTATEALSLACASQHSELVRLLLSNGVNPNVANLEGDFPFFIAAGQGDLDTLKLLREAGVKKGSVDGQRKTALENFQAKLASLEEALSFYGRLRSLHPAEAETREFYELLKSRESEIREILVFQ